MNRFLKWINNPVRLLAIGAKVSEAVNEIQRAKAPGSPDGAHINREERLALYGHGLKLLADLGLPLDIFKGLDETKGDKS